MGTMAVFRAFASGVAIGAVGTLYLIFALMGELVRAIAHLCGA